ncbi:hypothetical protein ACVWY0_002921 [Arthrobacter sp. UYNi723]
MTEKLSILVRVDLDEARAQVSARGHVTTKSIHALYSVLKRANSLREGLQLEIDVASASVDPDALDQLKACSRAHHLPLHIDPLQPDCRFSIMVPHGGPALIASAGPWSARQSGRAGWPPSALTPPPA